MTRLVSFSEWSNNSISVFTSTQTRDDNTLREGKQQDRTWVKDQHHVLLVRVKKSQLNTLQWHNPGPYVQVRGLKPKERIKRLSSVETSELI